MSSSGNSTTWETGAGGEGGDVGGNVGVEGVGDCTVASVSPPTVTCASDCEHGPGRSAFSSVATEPFCSSSPQTQASRGTGGCKGTSVYPMVSEKCLSSMVESEGSMEKFTSFCKIKHTQGKIITGFKESTENFISFC